MCKKGCCNIKISPFKWEKEWTREESSGFKAGVFIFDSSTNRILLVQSCGFLWGPPKGSVKKGETIMDGAIREVKEETGIELDPEQLVGITPVYLKKKSYYYILDMKEQKVSVQKTPHNDANGITWININCLQSLRQKNGRYVMTKHSKIIIERIFGIKMLDRCVSCPIFT